MSAELHPEFFQGDLLFSLGCKEVVPVLAGGMIPLSNETFPRGLLTASRSAASEMPFEIGLLPKSSAHRTVLSCPPWTEALMRAALARVMQNEALTAHERVHLGHLMREHFLSPDILRRSTLSDQLLALASTFWGMVTRETGLPPLVMLEYESLAKDLIIRDLADPTTLVSRILFEPEVILDLYQELRNQKACWHVEEEQIVRGTFLFWALDRRGRIHRLQSEPDGRTLVGSGGHPFRLELTVAALTEALRTGAIIPSVFMLFAVTAFARGLACAGGILQTEYLPAMAEGLAQVFRELGEPDFAAQIAVDSPFATGLVPLRAPTADHLAHCPAGPVDLMLAGGLTRDMLEKFAAMKLSDAVEASLAYLYEDRIPAAERIKGWLEVLRGEPSLLLHPAGRTVA